MDELDQKIEEAKARLKKTQQLAELNLLQKQADSISQPAAKPNDPMARMMAFAFPIGGVCVVVGLVVFMVLRNDAVGLMLDGLGAVIIGIKIALTPSIRIPVIDDRRRQQPKEPDKKAISATWIEEPKKG